MPGERRELFGWVVREGVTNAVRHSNAQRVHVHVSPTTVEVVDDGIGAAAGPATGHGLEGLRERVAGAGGRLEAGPVPSGRLPAVRRGARVSSVHAMIRLLIADDQSLVRGALAALLNLEDDLEVVAEVGRGDEVVGSRPRRRPDVALLDIEMPGIDGIAAAAPCAPSCPTCQVIVVTTFGRPGYLRRAMEAGASGFVVKDIPAEQLADAIRRVHAGLRVVDPALAAETLATGESPLTARERDVLSAARGGGTVADIAGVLFLSDGTVRNYLSSAIGKTGARTRAEAARVAEQRGWL